MINTKISYNLTGKEAAESLEKVGIICNKQMLPYDTEKPWITSGIRLGSPALTTRGLSKKEFKELAGIIHVVLQNPNKLGEVKEQINSLTKIFPFIND